MPGLDYSEIIKHNTQSYTIASVDLCLSMFISSFWVNLHLLFLSEAHFLFDRRNLRESCRGSFFLSIRQVCNVCHINNIKTETSSAYNEEHCLCQSPYVLTVQVHLPAKMKYKFEMLSIGESFGVKLIFIEGRISIMVALERPTVTVEVQ